MEGGETMSEDAHTRYECPKCNGKYYAHELKKPGVLVMKDSPKRCPNCNAVLREEGLVKSGPFGHGDQSFKPLP
ncbi:MAG: hypothetical protein V1763_00005 [Parcubacteria group bacterium]